MEVYLNTPIKEVISKFPKIGEILEEDEQEVMARVMKVIYPDQEIKIPKVVRKSKTKSKEIKYSPPMKKLVDEHVFIKRWITLIPQVLELLNVESPEDLRIISEGVDFIRSYADKFHHAKEEDILFKYFDENLDILKVIQEDHKTARNHVKAILEALEPKDLETL